MATDIKEKFKHFLEITKGMEASDLHLSPGYPPILRIKRNLTPISGQEILTSEDTKEIAFSILPPAKKEKFLLEKEVDLSFEYKDIRGRINIFYTRGKISIAIRAIPKKVPTFKELNLPPILHYFTQKTQGFVVICGPASHGKSTTMAAIVEEINQKEARHIITIEDPIEYLFEPKKSVVEQREVGFDTLDFHRALRSVFRQDPDVIMIGEMRDPESISIALSASETGHLVLSTLHTNSAAETIHRIIDCFPGARQSQVRAQLAGSLVGIISERLVPTIKGDIIPACEILINTPAIANLIREGRIHEIPSVIETSAEEGMISLNQYLTSLVREKRINFETALKFSLNPTELKILLK